MVDRYHAENEPQFDSVGGPNRLGAPVYGDIRAELPFNENSLGDLIADGKLNLLDIATQYNFSPERVRLYRNGSREFPQYNTVSQFEDAADHWKLKPDAGDTMHIESAESATYVVNYSLLASFAFQLNQSLQDGDALRVGPRGPDDANGWYMEQRGADHTDTQMDIIELSNGSTSTLASDVELDKPTTGWYRYECEYGWYAVLNQIWKQTYTVDGDVTNRQFAKTSRDGARGPEEGNLNLWYEIEAGGSTTGLELEVGSMGMVIEGNPTSLTRDKKQFESETVSGTDNAWIPIYAFRIDPDDASVNSQFKQLEALNYGANDDCELVVAAFDPSKTDATEWTTPDYHHDDNSVFQKTTNVSQVANSTGSLKTLAADEKYGGLTVASAVVLGGGNTAGTSADANRGRVEKKSVLASDHYVMLARTGTTESTLDFTWDADQNW